MQNIKSAEVCIRHRIKYSAHRCYVANISANDINYLWCRIGEYEFNGCGHEIQCGHMNADILQAAFLREMSLNPLRFDCVNLSSDAHYSAVVTEIVNDIKHVLRWFSKLWPNGIQNKIEVLDITDEKYRFLVAMRNCFKKIAQQNTKDFNRAAYRNEIIAHFADAPDIKMSDDIRAVLQAYAAKTAETRAKKRADTNAADAKKEAIAEINQRMKAILVQMGLHVRHDKKYYDELQAEYDTLAMSLSQLTAGVKPAKPAKRTAKRSATSPAPSPDTPKTATPTSVANSQPRPAIKAQPVINDMDDDMEESDSAEREIELLRSLTPEHRSDEIFQDYVQNMVGLNLKKYNQNQR